MKMKLKQVECGSAYSAALMDSGQLFTWGRNAHGQLGHGDREASAVPRPLESMHRRHVHQVACGAAHMIALTTARDVFTWGSNQYGQLGHGDPGTYSLIPKQVRVMSGLDVKQLAAGENHSCVLTSFGDIYTWGRGDYGQLGHGNLLSKDAPTLLQALDQRTQASWLSVGADFMMAVTYSGTVYSWGRNHFGQLGHGVKNDHISRTQRLPDDICSPQILEFFSPPSGDKILLASIVCGNHHVLAISERRDTLYAWGRGEHGQLGLDPRDCRYKVCVREREGERERERESVCVCVCACVRARVYMHACVHVGVLLIRMHAGNTTGGDQAAGALHPRRGLRPQPLGRRGD